MLKPIEQDELIALAKQVGFNTTPKKIFVNGTQITDKFIRFAQLIQQRAQPAQEKVSAINCGVSRAEWHDKAWALYHAKTFDDTQLSKAVNIHTIRAIFDTTFDALSPADTVTLGREEMDELLFYKKRLSLMVPLFEEARDAITAIPLAAAKLRNLNLSLSDRMDTVGFMKYEPQLDAARATGKDE